MENKLINKLGLIGFPLGHSFSKKYFTEKFKEEEIKDWEYELYPLANISELSALIKSVPNLRGLNVTIPYKQSVIPFLDEIDKEAKDVGAVNCIAISHVNNRPYLKGYNTDIYGFEKSLKPLLTESHKHALILGSGGASKAASHVLKKLNISFQIVSRHDKFHLTYFDLHDEVMKKYTLIINATPLGMYPDTHSSPDIPYKYVGEKHLFFDMVYNPEETLFLKKAKNHRAMTKNGLEMLYLQAEKAWEIFSDHR